LEAKAKIGNYRLCWNEQWKPKSEGFEHAYMTQAKRSDKMIPRHVSGKPFMIRFPDRSEWKKEFQLDRKGELIWYTDGSKEKKKKKRH
jgi:hypothetical protein